MRDVASNTGRSPGVLYSRAVEGNAWRLLTLVGVIIVVWIVFHIWTGYSFHPGIFPISPYR